MNTESFLLGLQNGRSALCAKNSVGAAPLDCPAYGTKIWRRPTEAPATCNVNPERHPGGAGPEQKATQRRPLLPPAVIRQKPPGAGGSGASAGSASLPPSPLAEWPSSGHELTCSAVAAAPASEGGSQETLQARGA